MSSHEVRNPRLSKSKPKGIGRLAGFYCGKMASNGAEHGANAENPMDVDTIPN